MMEKEKKDLTDRGTPQEPARAAEEAPHPPLGKKAEEPGEGSIRKVEEDPGNREEKTGDEEKS